MKNDLVALFSHFRDRASNSARSDICRDPSLIDDNLTLGSGTAKLRLRWHRGEESLILEITHGPAVGPIGWYDLYKVTVHVGDDLPLDRGVSFHDALEYGLELMGLGEGRRASE